MEVTLQGGSLSRQAVDNFATRSDSWEMLSNERFCPVVATGRIPCATIVLHKGLFARAALLLAVRPSRW
jgi:hypothetical protein